jgi:acetoin utilization protein AcuA
LGKDKEDKGRGGKGASAPSRKRTGSSQSTLPEKPPFMSGWDRPLRLAEVGEPEVEVEAEVPPKKNTKTLATKKGSIDLENYYTAEKLEELAVDDGIMMFSRNDPERQKRALVNVSRSDGGNVIVGVREDVLVSYIGMHRPSERERWGKPSYPWLYELGAIEVSRNYRRIGLAEAMLDMTFDDPFYDDKIILTTGFTWHWDLEGTGMDKTQYRSLGIELFARYGFMEMGTDEPNVTMDASNLFLARLGKSVSFSRYQKFASLLFSNDWEAMLRGF